MVDAKGEPFGMVQPLVGNPVAAQDTITKWAIEQFIRNAKTATPDIPQQKEHLFDAYAFVSCKRTMSWMRTITTPKRTGTLSTSQRSPGFR